MIKPLLVCAAILTAGAALSQEKRASPHEKTTATVGGATVTIEYGRPYMKGRQIYGGLVPYGQIWRTGADEATKLTTTAPLQIGDLKVPAGSYALFTIPTENEWTLVVSKDPDQMGAYEYDQKQDLGRTKMKVEKGKAPVEQLTISIDGGVLKVAWADTVASVPVKAAK